MTTEEKFNVERSRNYIISKSNHIVQKSRYELSVTEQRAICYICSLVKPTEEEDTSAYQLDYEFEIKEYAKICGISSENGRIYEETKSLLKELITKVMWLSLPDGTETTVNWIQKVWTNKRNGKAKIRLDEDMIPYLFNLKEKFTSYGFHNILKMKKQYSIRLFEILKSYEYQKCKTFKLDDLKKLLMVSENKSYNNFADFRKRVLQPALDEINELTELSVKFETVLKGKKVDMIKFHIKDKEPLDKYITYKSKFDTKQASTKTE